MKKRIMAFVLSLAVASCVGLSVPAVKVMADEQHYVVGQDSEGKPIWIYDNGCVVQDGVLLGCVDDLLNRNKYENIVVEAPKSVREIAGHPEFYWHGYDDQGKPVEMRGWSGVRKMKVPESVRKIDNNAFAGSGLREIEVPETTKIGSCAFKDCGGMADENGMVIVNHTLYDVYPSSEETESGCAFDTIEIPEGVTKIDSCVFTVEGGYKADTLILPSSLQRIESDAFRELSINHLIVKEGLEWIPDDTFWSVRKSLQLPKSLKCIGNHAMRVNPFASVQGSLDNLDYYGNGVFWKKDEATDEIINCTMRTDSDFIVKEGRLVGYAAEVTEDAARGENGEWVQHIHVPEGTKEIGSYVFAEYGYYGCPYERYISLPEGVTKIESDAFSVSSVKSVDLPKTVQFIGDRSFLTSEITQVNLSEGLETIGEQAFEETQLTQVKVPSTVRMVGANAFRDCLSLSVVDVPENTVISGAAFKGCDKLADENGLVIVNDTLFDAYCCKEKQLAVPSSVASISEQAFIGVSDLHYVYVPETIEDIAASAFSKNAVYFGKKGSVAETAAKNSGVKFFAVEDENAFRQMSDLMAMGESQPKYDVDCDNEVTLEDARLILQEALGIAGTKRLNELKLDADESGEVTLDDALLVLSEALGIPYEIEK